MFKFLRDRKRKKLAKRPFPKSWEPIVAKRLGWIDDLDAKERERARTHLKVFLWEKHWIGAREFEVTEEMKISDFCGDSLEYLELLLGVEMELDLDTEVPDANAPAREATVGELADWIVGVVNG